MNALAQFQSAVVVKTGRSRDTPGKVRGKPWEFPGKKLSMRGEAGNAAVTRHALGVGYERSGRGFGGDGARPTRPGQREHCWGRAREGVQVHGGFPVESGESAPVQAGREEWRQKERRGRA